jgi:outer membrane protein assembly factor BamE (lipoprotein component of BamABCDE complex)
MNAFRWRPVLGLVAVILAVGLAALAAIHYWNTRPLPFDRAVWIAEAEELGDFRRHRMADSLVQQRRLIGMSRADVLSMLGEPTATSHFRRYDLVYWLGDERGWMSVDSEWLVMKLDEGGRASSAEIARD